ncbi:MAG: hypothetical protein HY606_10755 [Planctomycetes bacterium]|nr:hypothetical protein [Planctomycetota bacterium]
MVNNRLKNLFNKDGKIVVLAADHPYFGYIKGLENTKKTLSPLIEYTDALMIAPGTRRHYFTSINKPIILRVSGCASILDIQRPAYEQELAKWTFEQRTGKKFDKLFTEYKQKLNKLNEQESADYEHMYSLLHEEDTMAKERLILSAKDAKELGSSAVAVSVYLRTKYEDQTLDNLATMARQAKEHNLPVLGVVAVGKRLGSLEQDADFLTRAGRMLVEHGADFVKTYYCGDGFERVVQACPVPTVVAGGKLPKSGDQTKSSLEMAYKAIKAGASGIDFGRRVWQHENPIAMIQALREIVHNKANVNQAHEKFIECSKR